MTSKLAAVRNVPVTMMMIAVLLAAAAPTTAAAEPQDRFPTTGQEALTHYEARVGDWLDGPVQYIVLDEERVTWEALETAAAREAFKAWFWNRRDPDLRDRVNPFKEAFYERVARANERFSGFPKGWKSDRGRVWVILGRPDNIRRQVRGRELTVWTYFTRGRDRAFGNAYGEMQVAFVQRSPSDYEIYGGFAPGQYPFYLQQAFELTRRAAIQDPFLEFEPPRGERIGV